MNIVIELQRPGKESRFFSEGLLFDDGSRVHTRTQLGFGFSPPWIGDRPARVVEKHLFYEMPISIMELKDDDGALIGHYCDIVTGLRKDGARYFLRDLFLDLWVPAKGDPVELDRDELLEASKAGLITSAEFELAETALEELLGSVMAGRFPDDYIARDEKLHPVRP